MQREGESGMDKKTTDRRTSTVPAGFGDEMDRVLAQHQSRVHACKQDHPAHDDHVCQYVKRREMGLVIQHARHAQHVCFKCGRAAERAANLCDPIAIREI